MAKKTAPQATQKSTPLLTLLVWTAVLTFTLIILGAATRVADAGLSCPDWPKCYGLWLPFPAPEGGFVSEGVHYTTLQVALEWSHRLNASIVGLFLLASLFFAYKARKQNKRVWKLGLFTAFTLFTQIKLGGVTVWLDNINWSVALHLGNAVIFYSLLIATIAAACRPAKSTGIDTTLMTRVLFIMSYVMVFVTMIIGAMVSTSHAGGICGGLFDCVGSWWPADDNYQRLHMMHRFSAVLTFLTLIALYLEGRNQNAALKKSAKVALIFGTIQVALGILTLYSFTHYGDFYQLLSVTHLAWATVLLTVVLTGVIKIFWGEKDPTIKVLPGHP